MLGPYRQSMLLDALRAPAGFELDAAIGMTFTLDLAALLAVPAASPLDTSKVHQTADLLERIRRHMDRTLIFCQAGAISIPAEYRAALTFVEQSVVEVKKPQGGLFHPKIWALRYKSGLRITHRMVVMSRNLTFDRAWDVMVRMDEADDGLGIAAKPLARFLPDIAQQSARPLSDAQRSLLEGLVDTLKRVRFTVPEPFLTGELLPTVAGEAHGPRWSATATAALAVSPFVTGGAARKFFVTASGGKYLVSRAASMNAIASTLDGMADTFAIKRAVSDAEDSVDALAEDQEGEGNAHSATPTSPSLRGLHAKLYVQDVGAQGVWRLGSANLTDAAHSSNYEFMVLLKGDRRAVGTQALVGARDDSNRLGWLLEPYTLPDEDAPADDEEGVSTFDQLCFDLASREFTLELDPDADDSWSVELRMKPPEAPDGVEIRAAILSRPHLVQAIDHGLASWTSLATELVTPFLVVTIASPSESQRHLVRAQLIGDPPDRPSRVLARAMTSRDDFLRYLAALLGIATPGPEVDGGGGGGAFGSWTKAAMGAEPVFEYLLNAASRSPERLDSLEGTLLQLRADPRYAEIVPAEFEDLWRAVREVVKKK